MGKKIKTAIFYMLMIFINLLLNLAFFMSVFVIWSFTVPDANTLSSLWFNRCFAVLYLMFYIGTMVKTNGFLFWENIEEKENDQC